MKIGTDEMILESTGRSFYANCNIIGIDHELAVSGGYDNGVSSHKFNQIEREELADYMISLWTKFKQPPRNNKKLRK